MNRKASGSAFKGWRWDGRSIAPHSGGVPLSDRGFRYGQHFFESIAIRNGKALLITEHLVLLAAAAKRGGFPFARSLSTALRRFLGITSLPDGMLRIYLTAGSGAPSSPIEATGCYVTWEAQHFPTEHEITQGFRLVLLKKPFLGDAWGEKSGNYAAHLEALSSARAEGADEGVVLDAKGYVFSCAMANLLVWVRRGNQIIPCTPPVTRGARSGAVMDWVKGMMIVKERDLRAADLRGAVSMAVTNSRLGVMPVVSLDGITLPDLSCALTLARSYLKDHGLLGRP